MTNNAPYEVLLDYDGFICKAFYAAMGRDEDIEKAFEILERLEQSAVDRACKFFNVNEIIVRKFVSKHSAKKDIYPEYKNSRNKNPLLGDFRDAIIIGNDEIESKQGFEADDFIIFEELKDREHRLTFSDDKDIKYYVKNYCKINLTEEPVAQDTEENLKLRACQVLAGDKEDCIVGIPNVGMKKAEKLLNGDYSAKNIVRVYKDKGVSLKDTIKNLFLIIPLDPEKDKRQNYAQLAVAVKMIYESV